MDSSSSSSNNGVGGEKGTLADFLRSEKFNRELSRSTELLRSSPERSGMSSSTPSPPNSPKKKGLLFRISPKRLMTGKNNKVNSNQASQQECFSDTEADDAIISPRSISSKDYFRNEGKLNLNTLHRRRSSLNIISTPRSASPGSRPESPSFSLGSVEKAKSREDGYYRCHQCRRQFVIDRYLEMFLAVKCPCPEPPYYFCNRECQKIHWISLHQLRDQCEDMLYPHGLMDRKLDWNNQVDVQYRFPLNEYVPCDRYF